MSGLGSAAAAGTNGGKLGSSKLLVAGLAGVGVAAGAGLLYYGYLKPKAAKKRQEELNKKFESGTLFDNDLVLNKVETKPKEETGAKHKAGVEKVNTGKVALETETNSSTSTVNEHAGLHQERAVSRDVVIPCIMASSFIGKNGAYVRKLQADTKTRISSKATLENGDRVYAISGLSHDVALAEHEVARFISLQPVYLKSEILIPNEYVGAVIGTKGETVRSLQERSKAKIQIDPQQDPEVAFFAPSTASRTSTPVLIRGTEKEIAHAKELIEDIVNKKMQVDQRNANNASRTNPRVLKPSVSPSGAAASARVPIATSGEKEEIASHIKADGTLQIYVTCVFDPNNFYIQVFNTKTSAQLNRLTEEMTEYYQQVRSSGEDFKFKVGDIVAAAWEQDTKMHRAQVLGVKGDGDQLEIRYVDYGDKRAMKANQLRQMKTEFLRLRFQALEATLNMEEPRGGWTDTVIDEFCNLTFAGQWIQIIAKRVDFLTNTRTNAGDDKVCVELYHTTRNNTININEELRRFIHALETAPQQQIAVAAQDQAQATNQIRSLPNSNAQLNEATQGAGAVGHLDFDFATLSVNGSDDSVSNSSGGPARAIRALNGSSDTVSADSAASLPSSSPSTPEKAEDFLKDQDPPLVPKEPPVASAEAPAPAFSYAAMARKNNSS